MSDAIVIDKTALFTLDCCMHIIIETYLSEVGRRPYDTELRTLLSIAMKNFVNAGEIVEDENGGPIVLVQGGCVIGVIDQSGESEMPGIRHQIVDYDNLDIGMCPACYLSYMSDGTCPECDLRWERDPSWNLIATRCFPPYSNVGRDNS